MDLTIPDAGSTTARRVLSRALARLANELHGIDAVRKLALEPGAVASLVRRPTIGVLLRCLRNAEGERRAAFERELVSLVALELALRDALARPIRVDAPPRKLASLGARLVVDVPEGAESALFEDGAVTFVASGASTKLALADLPREDRFVPIGADCALALFDNNPLSMVDAHPEKHGNAVDLGGHPIEEWRASIGGALARIERYLPDLRAEMQHFMQQIVPVGFDPERHFSASYQQSIGTVYSSLHPNSMTMAEALIHETSHNKLNALFEIDDVLENAWSPLYTSPVRPDPRPLHGILLAVHAFLPVARLYELMIAAKDPLVEPSFLRRYADVRRINAEGAEVVLTHAKPTPAGRPLFDELRRWIAYYERAPRD